MIKNMKCNPDGCGIIFTVQASLNPIAHEHMKFCMESGYEYKEATVKKDGNDLVLCCPKCDKEGLRLVGGWR